MALLRIFLVVNLAIKSSLWQWLPILQTSLVCKYVVDVVLKSKKGTKNCVFFWQLAVFHA